MSGAATASFVYVGDGRQVKAAVGGVTTVYVGDYYEWTSAGNTKYYFAGGQRVAKRRTGHNADFRESARKFRFTPQSDGDRTFMPASCAAYLSHQGQV